MVDIVLSERIPSPRRREALDVLRDRLHARASGLEVEFEVLRLLGNGWPNVRLSGPDEEIYTQILKRDIGFAVVELASLELNTIVRAYVDQILQDRSAMTLDIGLDPTEKIQVEYRASDFRAQLFDGRPIPMKEMTDRCCLRPGFPLKIRIPKAVIDQGRIEAELSDRQVETLTEWREDALDRLIIQGSFAYEVEDAVRTARLERDVAHVEKLSLAISVLICKLGTSAKGLVPKLGPLLKRTSLCVFHREDQAHWQSHRW